MRGVNQPWSAMFKDSHKHPTHPHELLSFLCHSHFANGFFIAPHWNLRNTLAINKLCGKEKKELYSLLVRFQ